MTALHAQNSQPSLVREKFSSLFKSWCFFVRILFPSLWLWEFAALKFTINIFKGRLGGEICLMISLYISFIAV